MANISKELQESLKRHNELLSYDIKKGKSSLNEKRYHSYASDVLNEQDPEEEGAEDEEAKVEGGDNPDFDFGGTEEGGTEGEETPEGEEAPAEGEEEGDEFGTADEFSAADEIEGEETEEDSEVEEVDVTDIVKRADDAKEYAEKAVTAATEGKDMIQDLMSQFKSLQDTLKQLDTLSGEITSIKKDIQSQKPKEKLELRSLDSYPFNVKLTDYWNDEKVKGNYEVTGSEEKYEIKPDDVKNYDTLDVKKSFVPESKKSKKRI